MSKSRKERCGKRLTEDLSGNVLATSLLVVHDTSRGGQNDVTERTSGEEQVDPVFDLGQLDVESGRDDSGLVDTTVELNDDLARSVVVNLLELLDVAYRRLFSGSVFIFHQIISVEISSVYKLTVLLHDSQESDNDLGGRTDENLTLSTLLSVVDVVEAIGLNFETLSATAPLKWRTTRLCTHENGNTHGYYETRRSKSKKEKETVRNRCSKKFVNRFLQQTPSDLVPLIERI